MLFADLELDMDAPQEEDQADQTQFVLSDEQWQAFTEALDRPARHLPQLEKLLREPSILERA
jgi:uncharacterized protein (DUF1778 family)